MNRLHAQCFKPLYQERVWGGNGLHTYLGRDLPAGSVIGESWEIVDRPEAQSIALDGPWNGMTLRQILEGHAELLMGSGWPGGKRFPILVKWLDCKSRLSLQVHPPSDIAEKLGGEPKTEHWYVAETTGDAALILGLKAGVTPMDFEEALAKGTLEKCVHSFRTQPGDSLLVESGRLHAIDAGNLILEVQQNSDTTYRVYDWGRLGLDGQPRQLHIPQTLQCIDYGDIEPSPLRIPEIPGENTLLADCAEFTIVRHVLSPGETITFPSGECVRLLHLAKGAIQETSTSRTFPKGTNLVLPYAAEGKFAAPAQATLLVTIPKMLG